MSLTQIESETGINYNDKESFAIVYTANKSLKNKLDSLCKLYPEQFKIQHLVGDDYIIKSYHIPKKCVKIVAPKNYSDEAKLRMKEVGHRLHSRMVKNNELNQQITG